MEKTKEKSEKIEILTKCSYYYLCGNRIINLHEGLKKQIGDDYKNKYMVQSADVTKWEDKECEVKVILEKLEG